MLGRPAGNFEALAHLSRTFVGEIFANDAYKLSTVSLGNFSTFNIEPSEKYTNPWSAESNHILISYVHET